MKFYKQFKDDRKPHNQLGVMEQTESQVRVGLADHYIDIDLAIQTLKDGQKLQTNFAIYWAE